MRSRCPSRKCSNLLLRSPFVNFSFAFRIVTSLGPITRANTRTRANARERGKQREWKIVYTNLGTGPRDEGLVPQVGELLGNLADTVVQLGDQRPRCFLTQRLHESLQTPRARLARHCNRKEMEVSEEVQR